MNARRPAPRRGLERRALAWRWGPAIAYMALIFVVSAQSDLAVPDGTTDLQWHTVEYLGLGVLVTRAVAGGRPRRVGGRAALLALAITVGYGASDELHQGFVPGRVSSLADLRADAIGAAAGVALCWAWGRMKA